MPLSLVRHYLPPSAATLGALALLAGALFCVHPNPTPIRHTAQAEDWKVSCGERCELKTIAYDGTGEWYWVSIVYPSPTEAVVVSGRRRPLAAAVTFNDGRRFVFDLCRRDTCRLPPAESAELLKRLRSDDTGALRVRLAMGGTTGLIDLPALPQAASAQLLSQASPRQSP